MEAHERQARTPSLTRRRVLQAAGGAAVVAAIGGWLYRQAPDEETRAAASMVRPDGKRRLPPGQFLIKRLRPMGGIPGDSSPAAYRLRVHGDVKRPLEIDFMELLRLPQSEQTCDVHCVTRWSMLDGDWSGVRVSHLAEMAGVKDTARHVIFEAAYGYTANVPLKEALKPEVLVAHRLNGDPLEGAHGAPVRALVPDLYFWKSAKWLTGVRFVADDEPGYWEVRGYHNHGDPWKEERYG